MRDDDAARCDASRVFPAKDHTPLPALGDILDPIWLESAVWAADGFNRPATMANPGKPPAF